MNTMNINNLINQIYMHTIFRFIIKYFNVLIIWHIMSQISHSKERKFEIKDALSIYIYIY